MDRVLSVFRVCGLTACMTLPLILSLPQAYAQTPKAADPTPQAAQASQEPQVPWLVNCATVKGSVDCEAAQRLTVRKTGQVFLAITVKKPADAKTPTMMLQLPHGMFLPEGVSLQVDANGAHKEAVQMCDPTGCYVGLSIDEKMLKSLKSGKKLSISFKSLTKEDINVAITLSGFEEAYQKLL